MKKIPLSPEDSWLPSGENSEFIIPTCVLYF